MNGEYLSIETAAKVEDYERTIKERDNYKKILDLIQFDMKYLDKIGIEQVRPRVIWERIELLEEEMIDSIEKVLEGKND